MKNWRNRLLEIQLGASSKHGILTYTDKTVKINIFYLLIDPRALVDSFLIFYLIATLTS